MGGIRRQVGYKCKTEGCPTWLAVTEMPDDSARSVHFVLRLEKEPRRLECPDCGKTHEYLPSDKKLIQPKD